MQSNDIQEMHVNHTDLFSHLSEMSGSKIATIYDVFKLYDILRIQKEQNKTFVLLCICYSCNLVQE